MTDDNGNGDGSYKITVRTVFEAVQEIKATLGDMSSSMKEQTALTRLAASESTKQVEDHESRLRILEARSFISWKQVSGGVMLLAASVAAFYPIFHR
jgi:multidrug resistance efflux pump